MEIEQIKVGSDNFSYLIFSPHHKKAALVDPGTDASHALHQLTANHLNLEYIILTHHHSDHCAETRRVSSLHPSAKIVASEHDGKKLPVKPDRIVSDGSRLMLGDITLDFLLTPGHTPGGICIIVDNNALLTGDTLFIGD